MRLADGDELVKFDLEGGHRRAMVFAVAHLVGQLEQPHGLFVRAKARGERRRLDFDATTRFPDLLHGDLAGLGRMRQRHDEREGGCCGNARPAPIANIDDPERGQGADRFADHGAADTQSVNQGTFARKLIANSQCFVADNGGDAMHGLLHEAIGLAGRYSYAGGSGDVTTARCWCGHPVSDLIGFRRVGYLPLIANPSRATNSCRRFFPPACANPWAPRHSVWRRLA